MDLEFWHERWRQGETGWHQPEINPHLVQHWPGLAVPPGELVFVPLCGKTLDLFWLARQGYRVLGVELSPIAVEGLFAEHGLSPVIEEVAAFRRYRLDQLEILCGDFFELGYAHLQEVTAVYDRAALIALPPNLRQRYTRHLLEILRPSTRILLITLSYAQHEMAGPPFSVSEAEVHTLLGRRFDIQRRVELDVLGQSPRFRERGLTRLSEHVYELRPRELDTGCATHGSPPRQGR